MKYGFSVGIATVRERLNAKGTVGQIRVLVLVLVLMLAGLWLSTNTVRAATSFQQTGNSLVMSNGNVRLEYNLTAGTTDFFWKNSKKISGFYSGVTVGANYIKGLQYGAWSWSPGSNQAIVTATGAGLPTMKQYFTLDETNSFLLRTTVEGTNLSVNWFGPVVVDRIGGVDLGLTNDNRALCVPFDNDHFVRYDAQPINSTSVSYEVAAFYDNTTRNGLVVGSVEHNTWKSGVYFYGANNKLNQMNVYGGAPCPWDVMPHGSVTGSIVSSPTMFVGFGQDWRVTMEDYAAANLRFVPGLAWTSGVPFGWNSWGVIQENINYSDASAVSSFFHNQLSTNFQNNGTAYINLDSFWDNLSPTERQSFVEQCHGEGQKAGIYFGPFVWFGSTNDAAGSVVEGSNNAWHYSDILLRDGNGNYQSNDGGWAVDPTHPGTKLRINYYLSMFTSLGFDFVKLDFLSHGALEGRHYDTTIQTGIQAYNQGMQYVLSRNNGRMFVSASISPLFPYQYAHSRRIACDAQTSRISDTEYTMNSVSYGWWLDGLYAFNDPDVMVFGNGASANEAQSRLISGAVTGLMLDGDDLTAATGQSAARLYLTNAAINDVARAGRTFRSIEGNTGTSAGDQFVRQDGATWLIAAFNYSSNSPAAKVINLTRAGLPAGTYQAVNLWDGTTTTVSSSLSVSLNAAQAKLFRLSLAVPASLVWNASSGGIWDNGLTADWKNSSTSQASTFLANDAVRFDDSAGVLTNVVINGTVSPAGIVVESASNNFTFGGSGQIGGTGSLLKNGRSTLTLGVASSFTGAVTITGGTIKTAASDSLAGVSAITVSNGSTLDFAGNALPGNKPVSVGGDGATGGGALFNSGNDFYGQTLDITLTGDATFGGTHRWDLSTGSSVSGPFNLKLKLAGGYAEWDAVSVAGNVGDLEIAQGAFGIKGMGTSIGNPANTITVRPGAELDFWSSAVGANSGYAKNIWVQTNATLKILISPSTFFNADVTLDDGTQCVFLYGSGGQTMNGPWRLNGMAHLQIDGSAVTFTNVISGPGGFVWDGFNSNLVFTAANTYGGPTIIGDGLKLVLSGIGSISQSSLIFFGGTDANSVRLDVSVRPDQTLVLTGGQSLAGIGAIAGNLVVSAGATLSPAGTNTSLGVTVGANSTGTISATSNIVLLGTTVLKLNGSGTNDSVHAGGLLAFGGTFNLVNINPAPLAAGDSFQIFSAASYSSAFSNIVPTTPGPGLAWDLTKLNTGRIGVVSQPLINFTALSANAIVLGGDHGVPNLSFRVLTATNLFIPMNAWTLLSTNAFDAFGNFQVTNPINVGAQQQFFLIRLE